MIRTAAVIIALAIPAQAHAEAKSPRDAVIAAFEASDCVLTLDQVYTALEEAGFDRDEMQPTNRQLAADGMIGLIDNDTGFLKVGPVCDGFTPSNLQAADPAILAELIARFEQEECRLSAKSNPFQDLEQRHDKDLIQTAVASLVNTGALTFDDSDAILTTGDICGK